MTPEVAGVLMASAIPLTALIVKWVPKRESANGNGYVKPTEFVQLKADTGYLRKEFDAFVRKDDARWTRLYEKLDQKGQGD